MGLTRNRVTGLASPCRRGQSLAQVVDKVNRVVRGWVSDYKLAQVESTFEELDMWLRRKLRCIV